MYNLIIKPVFDRFFGVFGLVLFSPLIALLIIVLFIELRENPFFLQKRVGKNNRVFNIIKFKTMRPIKDRYGKLLSDKDRLTPIGRFLRKTSIDELPQFFNLIMGNMSLIGPRPLLVNYLPLYDEDQAKRHLVRPGITGLAQVNGRNSISWEEKFSYDIEYVNSKSLSLDAKILIKSFFQIFKSQEIYTQGEEVKPFLGNE
ncbi:sugar transferase [Echinicola sp. CAU 1574]|uniref:Sugar transferase n=1 Tax=Echinicola arenosa TaxID=2774144 RepID=A0ABR9AQU1_9BACT|nr:sugar transferase [Echinicola arenosa]MBD8491142.1 sugar transferase [Echinicola arenosa]